MLKTWAQDGSLFDFNLIARKENKNTVIIQLRKQYIPHQTKEYLTIKYGNELK